MENQHIEILENKLPRELDPDIRPLAHHQLNPNASEFELAVLGTGERAADIGSEISPRSKIRVAAILVALNVGKPIMANSQSN
jgi:hypothetical protein